MAHVRISIRPVLIAIAIAAATVAAFVSLVPASAGEDDPSQGDVRRKDDRIGRELTELRTARSRTYATSGGTNVTRVYASAVNFRSGGEWKPIDNDLVPSPKAGVALENDANSYALALPDSLAKPVEVRNGEDSVRFALEGANGAPSGQGVEARYDDALPGVDVAYQAENDAVKESLVLASPDAGSKFAFDLELSDGLRARENDAGGIDFVRDGKVRMSFAPPFMRDSAHTPAVSKDVSFELRGDQVVLRADASWLRSDDRQYPVVIDPTTNVDTSDDCYIAGGTDANTSFCGYTWPYIEVGKDGAGNPRRGFMRVDTSAIPKTAEVIDGKLFLYVESGTQRQLDVHRVTRDSTSARTWNKYDGTNNWTTAGGDIDSSAGSNSAVGGTAGWYSIPARKLAQGWVDGSINNYGLIVKDNGTTNGVLIITGDAANDPYMEFEWHHRTGDQDRWTMAEQQLSDRMSLKTNVANGNLMLEEADIEIPGTAGHDLSFKRYFNNMEFDTDSSTDDLGRYWRSDQAWDVWLQPESNGAEQAFNGPSNFWATYGDRQADGKYASTPTGMNADLKRNADLTHTLTYRKSNRKINFNTAGDITSDKDRNDNTISYTYGGPGGRLTAIKDTHDQGTANNTLTLTYTAAGYIDKVTDRSTPTVRTWDYNYTGQLLTSYINPEGDTTTYTYDANENLDKITDTRGTVTDMDYDSSHRVTSITRDEGGIAAETKYEYPTSLSSDCSTDPGSGDNKIVGETIERDPLYPNTGSTHTTKYCWDKLLRVQRTIDGRGEKRKQDYTSNSDVTNISSMGSQAWKLEYNGDRADKATAPTAQGQSAPGLEMSFGYDDANHGTTSDPLHWLPVSFKDTQKKQTDFAYDSEGNMTAVKLPLSGTPTINITPNANGTTQQITDARGNATSYTYETDGDLDTIDRPSTLLTETMDYDALHRLTSHANASMPSVTETYGYDKLDRMTSLAFNAVNSVTYGYDDNGNMTSRSDATGSSTYVYDKLNRLTQENLPGGRTNNYTYDKASNLATLQDAGGTTTYTYGASNLLATLQAPGDSAATTYTYNKDAQRTKTTYPNGVALTMDFEDKTAPDGTADNNDTGPNRLKSIEAKKTSTGTVLSKFTYGYSPNATLCGGTSSDTGIRHQVTNKDGVVSKYCYDGLNRLTKADHHVVSTTNTTADYDWTLDATGNITKVVKNTAATSFGFDSANRMCWRVSGSEPDADCTPTPTGATTYAYDTMGNLDTSSAGLNLDYNTKGQTTSMTNMSGGGATTMSYAGTNQFERFTAGGTTFTNNATGVGAETTGTATTYYRRDPEGGLHSERLASTGNPIYYYAFDGLGSVSALTDSAGAAPTLYAYEPYGETAVGGTAPTTHNPWRYTSSYLDSTGFYKMGMRYYRPELMRWTQRDPVEQPTDAVQAMRYGYVGGNPVNYTDPTGMILGIELPDSIGDAARGCATGAIGGAITGGPRGAAIGCGLGVFDATPGQIAFNTLRDGARWSWGVIRRYDCGNRGGRPRGRFPSTECR